MSKYILGISAYYHDSAAALLKDGEVLAAAHEERFTRKKHDASFPVNATKYVLDEACLELGEIDAIAFYDKPYLKFERLLETYHAFAPKGLPSFLSGIPVWIKEKLFHKRLLKEEFAKLGEPVPKIVFPEHHLSHAASAFYPSPYEKAAILTIDGVGEWATTTIGKGDGKNIEVMRELTFPHSLGLLYSAFTYWCGFRVNSGEYKLMGLAPYGAHGSQRVERFKKQILDELIDLRQDGSLILNMDYFDFATGLTMCCDDKWSKLFGVPRRPAESELSQEYMDLALAIQQVTEDIVFKLAKTAKEVTGCNNLVMSGGVALNCVANGKLLKAKIFDDIWIQPAAGDAGGSVGAAYAAWHIWQGHERKIHAEPDAMQGAYLGPAFCDHDATKVLERYNAPYKRFESFEDLTHKTAELISQGNVIGWFQGRMEYGPRALGNRSILGDPRDPEMQKKLNLKIKYREGFRPFAPSVLEEEISTYFEIEHPSPYMLLVAPVQEDRRTSLPDNYEKLKMYERLYHLRSDIPAITHVDYSARIQSVNKNTNYRYWRLIKSFQELTGCGLVVNTSFNVRGEPIVCTPFDAYQCFMRTEMDYLVLGDILLAKTEQPNWSEQGDWHDEFELD